MAAPIKLPHKKPINRKAGRNFVRTRDEAEAFRREVAAHHAKFAERRFPALLEKVKEHAKKEIPRIFKAYQKSKRKDDQHKLTVAVSEWIMEADEFIINQLPIEAGVKKQAHANRQHEARLAIALMEAFEKKPIMRKTIKVILERAITQMESLKTKPDAWRHLRTLFRSKLRELEKTTALNLPLSAESILSAKRLNHHELQELLGPEYSKLYIDLFTAANKAIKEIPIPSDEPETR